MPKPPTPKRPTGKQPTSKRPPSKQPPSRQAPSKSAKAKANAAARVDASNGKGRPAAGPRRASTSAGRPGWVVPAVVVAVVVALFAVAVIATKLGGDDGGGGGDAAQIRPVTVTGAALPGLPSGGSDPAVGLTAPTVRGTSFDGQPVEIGGTGRPQMVLFVAHWCPHCQKEVPLLAPELGRITPPGVEFVAVSTGTKASSPNYPPSEWLEREKWPTKVLADDEDAPAAKAYGLGGYPYFVLLDKEGKVVSRGSGEKTVAEVEALLRQVA